MKKEEIKKMFVVTLINFDDDGNYEVDNWIANTRREARNIVEQTIKEIKNDIDLKDYAEERGYIFTKWWFNPNSCCLCLGPYGKDDGMGYCMNEYKYKWHFTINESLN